MDEQTKKEMILEAQKRFPNDKILPCRRNTLDECFFEYPFHDKKKVIFWYNINDFTHCVTREVPA